MSTIALSQKSTISAAICILRGGTWSSAAANTNWLSRPRGAWKRPEWQARALSGLADAQYMDCRMATALSHFADCVDLCEAHDLTRIAVPNRVMMGHCRIYTCEFDLGLDDMRVALEAAVRIGNRHAEMFANQFDGYVPDRCRTV